MTNKDRVIYILGNIGVLENRSDHCTQKSHDYLLKALEEAEQRGAEGKTEMLEALKAAARCLAVAINENAFDRCAGSNVGNAAFERVEAAIAKAENND